MIISASRRTDIPAFYSQWFFNRIKEGYVLVPNPYHPKMISKISLSPAVVDCFCFLDQEPGTYAQPTGEIAGLQLLLPLYT